MNDDLIASAVLGTTPPKKVDNKTRTAWNQYVSWLDKKGLKGHPSLDHDDLGFKMIDQFRKENPDTPLTKEMVIPIQQEFSKYRDYALQQVKQGRAALGQGVTEDNFLRQLSIVDGIPGQRTTSFQFPEGYLKDMQTGEVKKKGFATADKPVADQLYTSR